MKNNRSNSLISSLPTTQSKKTINQKVYDYLQDETATTKMISFALEIKASSLCGGIRVLEEKGLLQKVKRNTCDATGNKAHYLTTNKTLFNKDYLIK